MLRRDYILRWTQELAKVIARLMGKDTREALGIMDEAYLELLKASPEELRSLPLDKLLDYLLVEKEFNAAQLEFVAGLMAREGELLYESGDFVQSQDRLARALLIFEHVEKELQVFSFERIGHLASIRQLITEIGEQVSDD